MYISVFVYMYIIIKKYPGSTRGGAALALAFLLLGLSRRALGIRPAPELVVDPQLVDVGGVRFQLGVYFRVEALNIIERLRP